MALHAEGILNENEDDDSTSSSQVTKTITKTITKAPFISVIVPVYNAAPYLRRCVDSLLAQTFTDYELILVDDGSTDGSSAICDEYIRNCTRVRVIHQQNAGVSTARNVGIEAARGKYISFVDADDWVEPEFLQVFVETIEHQPERFDMVIQGYVNHKGEIVNMPSNSYFQKEHFGAPLTEAKEKNLIGSSCNKIYSLSRIKGSGLFFNTDVPIGEDTLFNMAFIARMKSFAIARQALYHYIDTGVKKYSTNSNGLLYRLMAFDEVFSRIHFFTEREKQLFLSKEFQLSVYVVRVVYHDLLSREKRIELLKHMKKQGKNNHEIRLAEYSFSSRMIAMFVLALPPSICDGLFISMRYVRNLI